jgi:hypothetical protein
MTDDHTQQAFIARNKTLLDKSAENIDSATRAELRAIRQQALNAHYAKPWWLAPAPAFAATAAVLVITLSVWLNQPSSLNTTPAMDDMQLVTANDELDFYQELEFYEWLEHEQQI